MSVNESYNVGTNIFKQHDAFTLLEEKAAGGRGKMDGSSTREQFTINRH